MYSYTIPIVLDSQKERFSKVLTLKKGAFQNSWQKEKPNISITSFQDIHLETIGEVAPYLFAISKVGKVQFHGNKDADGKFDLNTLTISFDSPVLKHFLKEWADSKVIIDHLRDEAQLSPDETTKAFLLNRADEIEQELELRMVDSQMLIQSANKKGALQAPFLFISCIFLKLQAFCKHKAQKPLIYKASGLYYIIRTQ